MSSTDQRRSELWALMQLRRLDLRHNPLRRRVDRTESLLLSAMLFAALLLVPAAAALGTAIADASERSATQRRAELRPVQARTLEDTASAVPSVPGQMASRVRVGWTDEAGLPREARSDVVIGTKAGTAVTIWLDRAGAVSPAPRQPADSAALGAAAGLTAVMLGWPSLWGLFRLARIPLDRKRARDWEREWAEISPRWKRSQY
jgi:hypothetical protein